MEFVLNQWVVSPQEAKELIEDGATVLDSRLFPLWLLGHLPNASHVNWKDFSQRNFPDKGKLLEDTAILQEKLRSLSISQNQPVVVLGNSGDRCYFGEDGRIVWMLRTLGHKAAVLVNGGHAALVELGLPIVLGRTKLERGDFTIERNNQWEATRDELKGKLKNSSVKVIDTRSLKEYRGGTPYGEKRGGHLPNALHFYFKDLFDEQGYSRPNSEIIGQLKQLGIDKDTPIITYCTGGVRSSLFTAVLGTLGFTNVKNYAGSTWEWSAFPNEDYPLI